MRTPNRSRVLTTAIVALVLLVSCVFALAVTATPSASETPGAKTSSARVPATRPGAKTSSTTGLSATFDSLGASVSKQAASNSSASKERVKAMLKKIHWLGHDGFRIDAENVIYFDPIGLKEGAVPADIILVTHEHFDHCSPADVAKIQKKGTVIVTTADCAKKLSGEIKIVKPGDKITVKGVTIEAVPAYNIDKKFHPKDKNWVGYIVTIDKTRIYHAGDTDIIPEMKTFKTDIAFLPVSGIYVMTAEEAAKAADIIKPQVAIPMHYGVIKDLGTDKDAETFKEKCSVPVEILKLEK